VSAENIGSIVGYLRLDRSDWDTELRAAAAKADELARHNPNIKISTNAPSAIAQLASVAAAVKRLQDAQGAEAVAQQRLVDLQGKAGVSAGRLKAAEEAVAKARRGTAAATVQLAAAHDINDRAMQKATTDAAKLAAAEAAVGDNASKATPPTVNLWAALAAVAPAAVPIAAVAGGALLGLIPVVATVALGVKGITDEFKSGALAGTQYGADIQQLQGWLGTLKTTAASGLLAGLDQAMGALRPLFATVNQDIALMSTQIGRIAAGAIPALVTILNALNPLFVTFGNLLANGAQHLEHWAQSTTGISSFVAYVQAELPAVMNLLGSLIVLVSHLAQGAAPFGGVLLTGITAFIHVLDQIPIGVLQTAIPLVVSLYAAFKVYQGITFIVASVNAALTAMGVTSVQSAETIAASQLAAAAATQRAAAIIAVAEAEKAAAAAESAVAIAAAVEGTSSVLAAGAAAAAEAAIAEAAAFQAAATAAVASAAEITASAEAAAAAVETSGVAAGAGWAAMAGPIGALVIGVAALGAIMFSTAGNTKGAADANNTYADSVKHSTDALNTYNITATNKLLSDQKAFSTLDSLKKGNKDVALTYGDLTKAVNGSDQDYKRLIDTLKKLSNLNAGPTNGQSIRDLAEQKLAAGNLVTTIETLRTSLGGNIDTQNRLNEVNRQAAPPMDTAAAAATRLALAVQALVDANISNAQAQNQMDSALASSAQKAVQEQQAITSAQQQSASASQQLASAQDAVTKASIAEGAAQRQLTTAQSAVSRAVAAESAAHRKLAADQAASTKATQAAAAAHAALAALKTNPNATAAQLAAAQAAVTKADAAASKGSKQVAADKKAEAAAQLAIITAKNRLAAASDAEKTAALQMDAAQRQVTSAQQAAASAATALSQAYAAASKSLAGLTEAAVQNRGDLIQQISSAEALAKSYDTGKDGAEKYRKKLLELRTEIINNAVANGANRGEVTKYVDSMLKIPKKATTKLELDAAKALKDLTALNKLIAAIVAGAKINAGIADKVFLSGERGASGVAGHSAGGGTVTGAGGPKSDSVIVSSPRGPWALSAGEEVVQMPYAAMWRPLLKQINAGQYRGSGINAPAAGGYSGAGAAMSNGTQAKGTTIEHLQLGPIYYPEPETVSELAPRAASMAAHQLQSYV
jgi:hypothetical protein